MNGEGPSSPQSGDSAVASSSLSAGLPTNITPSITLIPIKQVFIFVPIFYVLIWFILYRVEESALLLREQHIGKNTLNTIPKEINQDISTV